MPPDPTAPLPPSERLPTKPVDIGQVAPDFDDRKHFNTLVIRPQYRITLRLGEIEELFPEKPDTDKGRMERMQVLGLFYLPLKHKSAAAAFPAAWDHYKNKILNSASDAQVDADIQDRLKKWVIDGGALPTPAEDESKPAEKNFAKLRFPGGYTFVNAIGGGGALDLNKDPKYPLDFGANMFRAESLYYKDNPVLGKVPLVAKVEKRADDQGQWKAAEGVHVYFQLLPPYPLPAFDPNRGCNQQLNRPPLRESTVGPPAVANGRGPKKLNDSEEARIPPVATDPQSGNCPSDRGGKRGKTVAGNIFEIKSVKGFNEPHPGRDLPHKPYPAAHPSSPSGTSHAHAAWAQTNEEGEAGALFMPSRTGGDRYRLRVYVGPKTLPSDGTGMDGVRVDTGALVVWRNIRISRYIQQPANAPEAGLLAQANNAPYNLASANDYLRSVRVVDGSGNNVGLPTADFSAQGNTSNVFDGIVRQFARGFCEVEIDRAAQLPETLSQADWAAARQQAVADATTAAPGMNINYNMQLLFCMEAGSPVNVNNAVCHLPMRTAEAYNAQLPAGSPQAMAIQAGGGAAQADRTNIDNLFWNVLMAGFLRSLTKNGYLPGITVVTGGFGATWQVLRGQLARNSGVAVEYRGAFVWLGSAAYPTAINVPQPSMTYGFSSNTSHEMGHTIYREHGPGNDPNRSAGGGANATVHDPLADSICVMSYRTCEGQFCAKCLFGFRGWNIAGMTQV